jgi:putative addiction module component (TIGR02574 family)
LTRPEQERLLRALLEELDGPIDPDADRSWLEEVQRRSAAFDAGHMESIPAEEVFESVRSRLKQ